MTAEAGGNKGDWGRRRVKMEYFLLRDCGRDEDAGKSESRKKCVRLTKVIPRPIYQCRYG